MQIPIYIKRGMFLIRRYIEISKYLKYKINTKNVIRLHLGLKIKSEKSYADLESKDMEKTLWTESSET